MKYSVIDISSSGMSFIVAEESEGGAHIVFRERIGMSLRHYVEGSRLSARGIEKLAETAASVKEKCQALGVNKGWLISTAALRYIKNFKAVQSEIYERTGMSINLIDGKTEAYCDYIANKEGFERKKAVLIDMGGASIEICDLSSDDKKGMKILDFGLDDLNKRFVKKVFPTESEADDIKDYIKKKLKEAGIPKDGVYKTAILSGSVAQAVYDLYCDYADIPAVDKEKSIEPKTFKKLAKHMFDDSKRSMLVLTNAPDKLYVMGSAMIALRTILNRFDVERAIVSDCGVKEGCLKLVLGGAIKAEPFELNAVNNDSEKETDDGTESKE